MQRFHCYSLKSTRAFRHWTYPLLPSLAHIANQDQCHARLRATSRRREILPWSFHREVAAQAKPPLWASNMGKIEGGAKR
jgi:hypothetical protein